MPYVRVAHRAALVRQALPNQQVNPRVPIQYQPPAAVRNSLPRHLPVLNAPIFPREYEFYEEEEEQQQQEYEEIYGYTTVVIPDQHGTITQRISTYRLFQNYPQQQTIRRVKPRHPSYIYYNR